MATRAIGSRLILSSETCEKSRNSRTRTRTSSKMARFSLGFVHLALSSPGRWYERRDNWIPGVVVARRWEGRPGGLPNCYRQVRERKLVSQRCLTQPQDGRASFAASAIIALLGDIKRASAEILWKTQIWDISIRVAFVVFLNSQSWIFMSRRFYWHKSRISRLEEFFVAYFFFFFYFTARHRQREMVIAFW